MKTVRGPELGGVLCVVQTPFRADGEIDEAVFRHQIDWLYSHGADGVVIGMVSEILRLSPDERERLTTLICEASAGRGWAVASVGAESTHLAVRQARDAASAGADAMMAAPPGMTQANDDELMRYFTSIAEAVDLPLVVQDASAYVGSALSIGLQARLQSDLGDRVLFKPESHPVSQTMSQLRAATGGQARVLEGTGGMYLIDSYRRGAVGTMPAGDLVWALVPLWQALTKGDFDYAYRIGGPLAEIVSLQTSSLDMYVEIEKYLLVRQRVFTSDAVRGPIAIGVDKDTYAEIDRLIDLLHDAVASGEGR